MTKWDVSIERVAPSKVTRPQGERFDSDTPVTAIFKVAEAGYVPESVTVRARIDPRMFTGQCTYGDLGRLEDDCNVVSVAVRREVHPARRD